MRALAVAWVVVAVGAAGALSMGGGAPEIAIPEAAHLAAHVAIFAVLAALLGAERPWRSLTLALVAGAAVELAQWAGAGYAMPRESAYDLVVDALAAMTGLAMAGRPEVARALGVWLHPAVVAPLGLVGALYASSRDLPTALAGAGLGVFCLVPAGVAWAVGLRAGRFADPDLRDRRERPALFVIGTACVLLLVAAGVATGSPALTAVAGVLAVGACAITALTSAGLKISGHVSVPLLLAVAVAPWSERGPLLLVAAAALLTWARVRDGVHRPHEVAAAWALAGVAWAAA